MPHLLRDSFRRQFDTAWKLAEYHFEGLSEDECLWRPAGRGPHVFRDASGRWGADWPEDESYDLGPPSIAWLSWHMTFWWGMVLDHSFGAATLTREEILWPGSFAAARHTLDECRQQWLEQLERLTDADLLSSALARWPISGRSFGDVVGWVNIELMKNVAEIGYARFLYTTRAG